MSVWPVAVWVLGAVRELARLENSVFAVAASERALSAMGPFVMDWAAVEILLKRSEFMLALCVLDC